MKKILEASCVKLMIDADFDSGELTWRVRTPDMFTDSPNRTKEHKCSHWNSCFSGLPALNYMGCNGYLYGTIMSKTYKAHRVIWALYYGYWPDDMIDHIDHNRSNNSITNLRNVSKGENAKNMGASGRNTSGFPGVSFCKREGRFVAQVSLSGSKKHLGYFHTAEEAHSVYLNSIIYNGFHENHSKQINTAMEGFGNE